MLPNIRLYWEWKENGTTDDFTILYADLDEIHSGSNAPSAYYRLQFFDLKSDALSALEWSILVRKVLNRYDYEALYRTEDSADSTTGYHTIAAGWSWPYRITRFVNDSELPCLQYRFAEQEIKLSHSNLTLVGHISTDWKEFVTAFFAEELYMRRKLAHAGIIIPAPPSAASQFVPTETSLLAKCPSLIFSDTVTTISSKHRSAYRKAKNNFITMVMGTHAPKYSDHIRLYEEAYTARLRKAYVEMGLTTYPPPTQLTRNTICFASTSASMFVSCKASMKGRHVRMRGTYGMPSSDRSSSNKEIRRIEVCRLYGREKWLGMITRQFGQSS